MIYFIRNEETGLIKIGVTINLQTRLTQLRSEYRRLELLGVMSGSFNEKTALHQRFARQRIRRTDWFKDSDDLRGFIERNTHMDIFGDSALTPAIDKPISLTPYVRAMLDLFIADMQTERGGDLIPYSDAIRTLFETHLPEYAQRARQSIHDFPAGE